MAQNTLPRTAKRISTLSGKMRTGIVSDGASVGVTVVTANQMRDDRIGFNGAETTFNAGRKSLSTVYRTFHTAERNLADWLGVVRTVLAGSFGQRWSTQWAGRWIYQSQYGNSESD